MLSTQKPNTKVKPRQMLWDDGRVNLLHQRQMEFAFSGILDTARPGIYKFGTPKEAFIFILDEQLSCLSDKYTSY